MLSDKDIKIKEKELLKEKSYFKPLKNAETGRQKSHSICFRMCIQNSELATQSKIRRVLLISSIM